MTPKPGLTVTLLRRHVAARATCRLKYARQCASPPTSPLHAAPSPSRLPSRPVHVQVNGTVRFQSTLRDAYAHRYGPCRGFYTSSAAKEHRLTSSGIRSDLEAWAANPANDPLENTPRDVPTDEAESVNDRLDEAVNLQQPLDATDSILLDGLDRLEAFSEGASNDYLRPRGSLVHRGRTFQFDTMAIILGRSGDNILFYTPDGQLEISPIFTDFHMVRGFATYEEIEPVASYLSEVLPSPIGEADDLEKYRSLIPSAVGAHLLEKMRNFQEEIDSEFRKYSSALEAAHNTVSHPTEHKVMLLEDVATAVTGKAEHELSEALLFAVMRFTVADFGFQPVPQLSALYSAVFVESQESVAALRRVQHWVRSYQEAAAYSTGVGKIPEHVLEGSKPLKSFAHKCRIMASRSRDSRQYSTNGQPLAANRGLAQHSRARDGYIDGVPFTSSDRDFIHCLMMGIQLIGLRSSILRTLPLIIVRLTGLYDVSFVEGVTIQTLLQEIGVLQTWQASDAADRMISLPNQQILSPIKKIEERLSQGQSVKDAAGLQDSVAYLRKDWGSMPVYSIDWQRTEIIDDGLSLEHVDGACDQYWLHWHTSHPSAFFSADHPLGQLSAHNVNGNYFLEANLPMLPDWLHDELGIGAGKPVITVSMKLDTDGNVLDKTIQPGIIHNIHRLNFEQANRDLGRPTNHDRRKAMTDRGMWTLHVDGNADKGCIAKSMDSMEDVAKSEYSKQSVETGSPWQGRDGRIDTKRKHVNSINFDGSQLNEGKPSRSKSRIVDPKYDTYETPISATETKTVLELLDRLAQGFAQKHPRSPFKVPLFTNIDGVKSPYSGVASPESHHLPDRARFAVEDPTMQISFGGGLLLSDLENSLEAPLPFTYVLGELGLAVCRSVAEWADERGIPLFYHGTVAVMDNMTSTKTLQLFRESVATLNHRSDNRALQQVKSQVLSALAVTTTSSSPRKDVASGVTHSAAISSPLRKHRDLVNLWQIDAALREEARLGRSLVGSTDYDYLPKSKAQMDKSIRLLEFRKKMSELFRRYHSLHWKCLAVARAFYLREGELPERLTASVQTATFGKFACFVLELDMFAEFSEGLGEDGNPVQVHETWQVQMTDVNMFQHRLKVRMIKRLDTTKDSHQLGATTVSSQPSIATLHTVNETFITSATAGV